MGELTQEARDEIRNIMKEALADIPKPEKKVVSSGDDTTVIVGKSSEEKLLEDKKGGFKNMTHFFMDVAKAGQPNGRISDALRNHENAITKTAGYMTEGDLSQGGYTVPEEFKAILLQTALESSIVASRATHIPMATNRVTIPVMVDSDHSSNYFGGVVIYRTEEGGSKTVSNPVFGKIALTLHKLTGLVRVTDELLSDSAISIEAVIRSTFGQAIAFVQDYDFLRGSGANQAVGAFSSVNPSLVTVAKETNQVATTIVADNILKMWSRLYPEGHKNAVWVAHIDTFPQLAIMSLPVGTGGIPIWMPAGGLAGNPYDTLMGRPLLFTEKMTTVGSLYDIGLADFTQYLIGDKGGVDFASSIHVYFASDETAFRFVMRYDGQPWWLSALTPKEGSNTLSPFVTLAVRS